MPILDKRKDRFIEDQDSRVSVGIDFPFNRTAERLFQPNLGVNLRQLLFEQMTEDLQIQIENNIVDVFERWLPFVNLTNINVERRDDVSQTNINIEFNIRRTPNSLESVQVTFDGVGGTTTTSDGAY